MDMKNIGRDNINCICFSTGPLAVGRWPLLSIRRKTPDSS